MVNMEKEKLTEEGTKDNHYKLVTDEYFKLFEAFKLSGFTEEQAFELMKAYCTSDSMARMLENYKFYTKSPKPGVIADYMRKRKEMYKSQEDNNENKCKIGFWIRTYNPRNDETELECSICGSKSSYQGNLKRFPKECDLCNSRMKSEIDQEKTDGNM